VRDVPLFLVLLVVAVVFFIVAVAGAEAAVAAAKAVAIAVADASCWCRCGYGCCCQCRFCCHFWHHSGSSQVQRGLPTCSKAASLGAQLLRFDACTCDRWPYAKRQLQKKWLERSTSSAVSSRCCHFTFLDALRIHVHSRTCKAATWTV
jgi:apolipoprotein N-acyltransferase